MAAQGRAAADDCRLGRQAGRQAGSSIGQLSADSSELVAWEGNAMRIIARQNNRLYFHIDGQLCVPFINKEMLGPILVYSA